LTKPNRELENKGMRFRKLISKRNLITLTAALSLFMTKSSIIARPKASFQDTLYVKAESITVLPHRQLLSAPAVMELPFYEHQRVRHYIDLYSRTPAARSLSRTMRRADGYIDYITERIQYHGLPHELIYLPLIESEYRPDALSHAGALGLWQFMQGSAAEYGLVIDEWRDDRKDFYLATDAALRKIKDETKILNNDILLALAAYNCGLGRMKNLVARCRALDLEPTFWNMYDHNMLPRETMNYVPKLLAVAHILENKQLYNLPVMWRPKAEPLRLVYAEPLTDLRQAAAEAGVNYARLREVNAGLRRGLTPDEKSKPYMIKVPESQASKLAVAVARQSIGKGKEPLYYNVYQAKSSDSVNKIAGKLNIKPEELLLSNPHIAEKNIIEEGMLAVISKKKVPVRQSLYTVKSGDNLWAISLRYGTTIQELAKLNRLDIKKPLSPGTKLEVLL
jgi:membrane-bound lytic murein transglycosylase D